MGRGAISKKALFHPTLMLNLLKRTMTYPGFEPGTFELAVSIPNHYTI
jgi:hypothetical protein